MTRAAMGRLAGAALARGPGLRAAGLPSAFAALPLYVVLPHYYASDRGLSLATVGALLMLVRLIDAGAEPLLGRLSDRVYHRTVHAVLWMAGLLVLLLGVGMAGSFFPRVQGSDALAAWMVAGLSFTCLAHSLLVITHQAWGVRLGAMPHSAAASWPGAKGPGWWAWSRPARCLWRGGRAPCWPCSRWHW